MQTNIYYENAKWLQNSIYAESKLQYNSSLQGRNKQYINLKAVII